MYQGCTSPRLYSSRGSVSTSEGSSQGKVRSQGESFVYLVMWLCGCVAECPGLSCGGCNVSGLGGAAARWEVGDLEAGCPSWPGCMGPALGWMETPS